MGWLTGWQYRRPVTIDNTQNSNDLTDYQVLVVVDTASLIQQGKMQADGDDIRFTDSDGTTLLPYWLEGPINDANTKIWVKVPSIPAQGTKVIYFYYGNPTASSESSVTDTFIREIDGAQPLKISFHMDEGSGGTVYDNSGNNNNGTIYGAVWDNDGRFGKALKFDGVDDYVEVPHNSGISGFEQLTVEFYFRTSTVKDAVMVGKHYGSTDGEFYVGTLSPTQLRFMTINSGSTRVEVNVSFNYATNQWFHCVGVYDGSLMQLFVNATLLGSNNQSGVLKSTTYPLRIAAYSGSSWRFNGLIDEVRIYRKALTSAEISDLYNYYGYTTPNYAGRVLVRKRIDPEPTTSVGNEETSEVPIIIAQRRLLIIGI